MKKYGLIAGFPLVLSLITGMMLGGCAAEEDGKLKVVTSTALIEHIIDRVGGDMVDVINIIPPAQCPGHFDVKPGDVQKLANAKIFLMHGWQGEQFTDELISSANNPDLEITVLNINGNWMTPTVQKQAADAVTEVLAGADSANKAAYEALAAKYKSEIDAKGAEVQSRLSGENLGEVKVMCNEQIAGLVQWFGFDVAGVYGRPDSLTPQVVKELVDKARAEGVVLFIDNLQSGADAAKQMAEELQVGQVTITNFPGGYDGKGTWEKAIDYDVELLLNTLAKQQ